MSRCDHPLSSFCPRSLRWKIITILLLSAGLFSLASFLYIFLSQQHQLRNELARTADNVIDRLAFTMGPPLWNFDHHYLEQLEDQELKNAMVLSVLVSSADQVFQVGRNRPGDDPDQLESINQITPPPGRLSKILYREKPILFDSQHLGTVRIVLTDKPIIHKLSSLILQQILHTLITLTAISLLVYLALNQILLRPLEALRQTATAYSRGDLSPRTNPASNDEIGQLAITLNVMAEQQSRSIQELCDTEAKLHAINQRLNDIIAFIPDAMMVIDSNGVIIAWNHAMERMTQTSADEMLGKGQQAYALPFYGKRRPILIDLLDLPDETLQTQYSDVRRIGNTLSAEACIPSRKGQDNEYLWGVAAALFDGDGKRCGAIEIIRDITFQKLAEKAQQESADFRKRVFDGSPLSILVMDFESWQFIDCNQAAITMHGFSSQTELLGKTPLDISAQHQYDGTPSIEKGLKYREMALHEKRLIFEWQNQRPDGELWDAEVHLTVFQSGKRQLIQFIAQDITERKRTSALMIQTEKMMMVGGLAAGMAHEINNPLGIITQTAQIIQRRLDPNIRANREVAACFNINFNDLTDYLRERQIPDFLANIRGAAARAAKIINNMLTFSRKSESLFEEIELPQLLNQVLELAINDYDLKKHYGFQQILIKKDFADVLPRISVTVLEIEQVLLNLLKNAAQALSEAGTPAPEIILRAKEENGLAVIEIQDNGPGMSADVQKRIFEPFYTTKAPGRGTGLGLSFSYAIITNNHRGSLEVHSQQGVGTCFTIHLPLSA